MSQTQQHQYSSLIHNPNLSFLLSTSFRPLGGKFSTFLKTEGYCIRMPWRFVGYVTTDMGNAHCSGELGGLSGRNAEGLKSSSDSKNAQDYCISKYHFQIVPKIHFLASLLLKCDFRGIFDDIWYSGHHLNSCSLPYKFWGWAWIKPESDIL